MKIQAFIAVLLLASTVLAEGWPMRSHDVRRTGRVQVNGARSVGKVWKYVANDGNAINIEAAVTNKAVYFGCRSWRWKNVRHHANPRGPKEDVKDADPVFYGIHE